MAKRSSTLITVSESDKFRKSFMEAPPASATTDPATASEALRSAWNSDHAALDEMRELLEAPPCTRNPRYRAKAYHCMMEIQAIAYNMAVAPRMATPRIHTNTGWHDLSGAGTHPGGGITGAPGYNAAKEVLRIGRQQAMPTRP